MTKRIGKCQFCGKENTVCFVTKSGITACGKCDREMKEDAETAELYWNRTNEY